MRAMLLLVTTGCSFERGAPALSEDSGGGGAVDSGASVMMDARMNDGPPDACLDDDTDGICNVNDDWPCGVKPTAPATTVSFSENSGRSDVTITLTSLDGDGRLAVSTPGQSLSLTFGFAISDTSCAASCIDQLEVGWVPGTRRGCVFDGAVDKSDGVAGAFIGTIGAPTTKQVYDLRVNLGQNFSCNYMGANNWWGGTPEPSRTIAKLCVH